MLYKTAVQLLNRSGTGSKEQLLQHAAFVVNTLTQLQPLFGPEDIGYSM